MYIFQIYTKYLIRKFFALINDDEKAYTHAMKHLVRIERMYGNPDQDNFYHYRQMITAWFTHKDGKWTTKW